MSGSVFGKIFRVSTWGESHGPALGAVIDGCPAGLELKAEDVQEMLDRRKPGASPFATKRNEADAVKILSGVFEDRTTGCPISLVIENTDQRSRDYSQIAKYYRPGHADLGFDKKYGFRDYRGGGRSSGRETAARVAAGAVAKKLLAGYGIGIDAYALSIGTVTSDPGNFSLEAARSNTLCMPDPAAAQKAAELLREAMENKDSLGGVIECRINGVNAGLGEPVFDKLDASLAGAVFSIGAVKGFEIGEGFNAARLRGSENNDGFYSDGGMIRKKTNHSGGILGGISDGDEIVFRAAIKPTPSISQLQQTVSRDGENGEIEIHGRHDPVIVPRAVVVVEAMAALVIADALLMDRCSRV